MLSRAKSAPDTERRDCNEGSEKTGEVKTIEKHDWIVMDVAEISRL